MNKHVSGCAGNSGLWSSDQSHLSKPYKQCVPHALETTHTGSETAETWTRLHSVQSQWIASVGGANMFCFYWLSDMSRSVTMTGDICTRAITSPVLS